MPGQERRDRAGAALLALDAGEQGADAAQGQVGRSRAASARC
jgi:hypothetical protein